MKNEKIEKFAKFNRNLDKMEGDGILWNKGEVYYIIDETDIMYCIDQYEYPPTKCWIDKSCAGDLFEVVVAKTKG